MLVLASTITGCGSYVSHAEYISVNNVLREYYVTEEEIKKLWNFCGRYYINTMETYCVSYKKYTANENSSDRKTKQTRVMLLSNCAICGKKKSTSIKNKELHNFNNIWND